MALARDLPLGLPRGSVRAILALGVVGAFIAGAVTRDTALIVLAFYFTQRGSKA